MKVAVISAVPTCGKSTLIEILGGVYSRSQGREVVVFTTGEARDNINLVENLAKNQALDNPYIIKSMIENATDDADNLRNYGVQAGDEHVFIFDILGSTMSDEDKEEFLLNAIDTIPADLTLIEICGDVTSELNVKVMEKCDCSIILTDISQKGLEAVSRCMAELKVAAMRLNSAIVMSRADAVVASDKKIAQLLKIKTTSLFKFPYNPIIGKLALDGELDKICYKVIVGDHEVAQLRMPMQELMEFLFNTPTRTIVRSMDRWYK